MPILTALDANIATAQYSTDGGTTRRFLPFITSWNVARAAAESRNVTALGNYSRTIAGAPGARTGTLEGIRPPGDRNWAALDAASEASELVEFSLVSTERTVVGTTSAGNTAAIATTGIVTLAGNPDTFDTDRVAPGMVIKIGSDYHVIREISSAGVATVDPAPASSVAAAVYSIVEAAWRKSITGTITNIAQETLTEGAEMTDSIEVAIQSVVDWTRVT